LSPASVRCTNLWKEEYILSAIWPTPRQKGRCILRSTRLKHWYLVGEGTTFGISIQAREPKKFTATGRKLSASSASPCCVSAVASTHRVLVGGTSRSHQVLAAVPTRSSLGETQTNSARFDERVSTRKNIWPLQYSPAPPTVVKLSLRFCSTRTFVLF
jgi:hypothetical protein